MYPALRHPSRLAARLPRRRKGCTAARQHFCPRKCGRAADFCCRRKTFPEKNPSICLHGSRILSIIKTRNAPAAYDNCIIRSAVFGVRIILIHSIFSGALCKSSVPIGKVCYGNGKSDAVRRRTHLRERVNTFSFCGTGGSFLFFKNFFKKVRQTACQSRPYML